MLGWLGVMYAYCHWSVLLTLMPAWVVQAWHFKRLMNQQFVFQQSRQWQFLNGKARLEYKGQLKDVELRAHQIWPTCIIVTFRELTESRLDKPLAWQWDMLMYDACEAESFRQLVALMRTEYLHKVS